MTPRSRLVLVLATSMTTLLGCEEPAVVGGPPATVTFPPTTTPPRPGAVAAGTPAAAHADGGTPPTVVYGEEAFAEADVVNRDPFRSYVKALAQRTIIAPQRRVIMPNVALEEMTLIAIVTGVPTPYAMMTDRQNVGYVVARGDFIGRPEVVSTGGVDSLPVQLNWRIDRIRDNELVVMREDPTSPDRPPLMRVLTLHSRQELEEGGALTVVEARRPSASPGAGAAVTAGTPPPPQQPPVSNP